jgi:hypothetical protein
LKRSGNCSFSFGFRRLLNALSKLRGVFSTGRTAIALGLHRYRDREVVNVAASASSATDCTNAKLPASGTG